MPKLYHFTAMMRSSLRCLQVDHPGKIGGDANRLKGWGVSFRKEKGLE
jgi:hypothetical protein